MRRAALRTSAASLAVVALITTAVTTPATPAASSTTPAALSAASPKTTAFTPDDHCLGQCHDVLPPGQNGNATLAEILAHKALGTRPAHSADQLDKYDALVSGHPGLTNDQLGTFFNDASFGVPADQVESTIKPRADVTIVRDKTLGMPHVYGTTRSGTEFGAGYAAAQDRLWLMDLFRHLGRGQLSGFAGGAEGNRALEQSFFGQIPYTEADLQRQIDQVATQGPRGRQALQDVTDYIAGINAYLTASVNGRYFPGEYVLTGHADAITNRNDIQPFKTTDLVAIAAVVGGLFGAGGGGEVQNALVKLAAQNKYGAEVGDRVWRSFREQNDPESVLTLHDGQRFPYASTPSSPLGVALPDGGVVTPEKMVHDATTTTSSTVDVPEELRAVQGIFKDGVLPADLLAKKHGMSNALAVSGAHTDTGNPIAVWGPQTGYFAPQLLMLQELNGPGIRARGVSFAGVSMYVQLGRGLDYSWSATSAGQDITDTYAVELCEPDGSPATAASTHYRFRSECLAMERIERKNAWKPTVADPTPAGSYTLVVHRTEYGLVQSRAQVGGKHVAYTSLRSTYLHEVDSIVGFQEFNDPDAIRSAQDFQRAAEHIGYAFNWFYADAADTAYFNSGANPVRAPHVDPNLPIKAEQANEWQGWNPDGNTASYTPFAQHPNSVNQDYYISWNNKQALDYSASGYGNGSVHRGDLLDDRVRALVAGGQKVTRTSLTQAMASAAVADLRAEQVLPELLRVIDSAAVTDPVSAAAVAKLREWQRSGSLRKETSRGSKAYAHAEAIRLLDAWWPLLVRAQFQPGLGDALYTQLTHAVQVDEPPSDTHGAAPHKGSAFQHGWWSYVDKDLRSVLGEDVAGPLGAKYCGGGNLGACRQVLLDSLTQAAAVPATTTYPGDASCAAGDQWCADTIVHRAMGGITQDRIHWQNRPTYQQVVQFPSRRGTNLANLASGATATASSHERGWHNSPPANAVDGKPDTRWASDWSDPQWLQVDLGASRTVGRVVLNWEAAHATSYRIEVSPDGTHWREVFTTGAGNGGQDLVTFTPTAARFVRMTGIQRATGYGYSLYELEVYVT
ncbi:penicillin acylase family protein [Actinosynnema sp. NPDC047251]|uniref:Putative penicillin acylase n=1 Tax=Saccharothrix espanaensis (strain ATCC 51144 / DSM 44229 / JCM 9112 / NBRC 15066 / NRRL 15764) TaxID=1179773 RepID=K0JQM4_SACES|nr:penicillin acylase family protein [Saccharothrix espanaensis]CCH27971.1 putative penicillin acylase [Saccharothrix espanaensis DSM 44229]